MSLAALSKRLAAPEARHGTDCIAGVVNLAGYPPEIVAQAVRAPRFWIADGRASRRGSTLFLRVPTLTVAEWSARHTPPTERPPCA